MWKLSDYCDQQTPSDTSNLAEFSLQLLQNLDLPTKHPFCTNFTDATYPVVGIPAQGPLLHADHLETWYDVILTTLALNVPRTAAICELWMRLLASVVATLGLAQLVRGVLTKYESSVRMELLILVSSWILWTDSLYVLEYGANFGLSFFVATSGLLLWKRRSALLLIAIVGLASLGVQLSMEHQENLPRVEEGLYHDPRLSDYLKNWQFDPQYTGTPWMPTGDSRTGLPFLLCHVPTPDWKRVFATMSDGEVVALDISFPDAGHRKDEPVLFVLHGLNGGSQEEYIRDLKFRAPQSTIVVMIARGLMDLPIRKWDVFHGARWTDAQESALMVRKAIGEEQKMVGVGYSMGAIIMANWMGREGSNVPLNAAVAISGGLDMRYEEDFKRAQRLWQPILTSELRNTFVVGKWGERVRHRLTKKQLKQLMRATHITEIDRTAVVAYNGFEGLMHYYTEMSLLGDVPLSEYESRALNSARRINKVAVPLLILHALDDPLVTWETTAANRGLLHPTNVTRTGQGNLVVLLTKRGGHVGWPLGWMPSNDNWAFMNGAAVSFAKLA